MNEHNPYEPPRAVVADAANGPELAGLGERLGAAVLDSVIMLAMVLPVMFLVGYFQAAMDAVSRGEQLPLLLQFKWGAIGIVLFYLVQSFPLRASGQTWGKRVLKIKIVDLDGNQPSFGRLAGLRYLPVQVANMIPFVGGLIVTVDMLMIFRRDRRCAHDLIAGTRVVKAR